MTGYPNRMSMYFKVPLPTLVLLFLFSSHLPAKPTWSLILKHHNVQSPMYVLHPSLGLSLGSFLSQDASTLTTPLYGHIGGCLTSTDVPLRMIRLPDAPSRQTMEISLMRCELSRQATPPALGIRIYHQVLRICTDWLPRWPLTQCQDPTSIPSFRPTRWKLFAVLIDTSGRPPRTVTRCGRL